MRIRAIQQEGECQGARSNGNTEGLGRGNERGAEGEENKKRRRKGDGQGKDIGSYVSAQQSSSRSVG